MRVKLCPIVSKRLGLALVLAALSVTAALPVKAAGLPDTGQDTCYNDTAADSVSSSNAASIARDAGTHPRQDCRYGRDPAAAAGATKTGGGSKGLDYTKIANNGSTLAANVALGTTATDWACTQDNITGLMWEVKTTSGLRNKDHTYTWFNSNASTNAGDAGTAGAGSTCATTGRCDTEKFVEDVNTAALCTYADWRLPSIRELLTMALLDGTSPTIDPTYFPNTVASDYWSSSSYVPVSGVAWFFRFDVGASGADTKARPNFVRLVRGGQF